MSSDGVAVSLRSAREPTPMQRGLLASQARFPGSPLQNMALITHLDGPVDPDRLATAFETVVLCSDVLRTTVRDGRSGVHLAERPIRSEILDVPRSEVTEWAERRARRPIDLGRAAYDSAVLRHGDGTSSWYLALHHAVTDATSSMLVFDRTAAAYHGEVVGTSSYYEWWQRAAVDPRRDRSATYWSDRPPAPRVGRLYEAVGRPDPASSRHSLALDVDLVEQMTKRLADDLRMISDDLGWTTALLSVAAVYLHRISGADRFAIGVPVHNRSAADARGLIGPLMEVFPVDVEVKADDTFRSLHARLGRSLMTTLRHARPGAAPSASDIEAVVNVIPRAGLGSFGEIPATTRWIHPGASDPTHLFRLQLTAYGEGRELVLDLNRAAAGTDHQMRAPAHIGAVLRGLVFDPDVSIYACELATADELEAIARWGVGSDPGADPEPVPVLLSRALSERDDVAVEDATTALTGRQLWARTLDVAAWLRDRGVGATSGAPARVGIELARSVDAVAAIYGTLAAGGSFVPLDPEQPSERRQRLAQRAGCVTVIRSLADVPEASAHQTSELPDIRLDDEAYLLFTSGSTGEPKGAPISHRGLARYLQFAIGAYESDSPPVAPLFTPLTFDLTITALFAPIMSGGRLVAIRESGLGGLQVVAHRADLTWCKATPSHLDMLRRMEPASPLGVIVVGGEAFSGRLARQLFDTFPGTRIFNEYGPTEAVVGCMIHEATAAGVADVADVPIGVPAPGVRLRVVDPGGSPVPIGAMGELLISHEGLTVGYLGPSGDGGKATTPDRSFVELDGRRWYRSGDLVRMADDRTLVYHGRLDEQVKVGGIRLDPSEVEAALSTHPAISRAVVRVWRPTLRGPTAHCMRCGLPDNVPGVAFDDDGICATCHDFDRVRDATASYFRSRDELLAIRDDARRHRTGDHDCLHLLSGGKDSTYALYQLVEMGFDVLAVTFDNGFISEGAKENVRRSVADLGVDHEFVTTDAMAEIFRDSLRRHSNVCHGCYKTIYTLATSRADELGIPLVVTGLSRGQLFETRLIPAQFDADRFDPEAIDRSVIAARRVYHRVEDAARKLLDTSVFDDPTVFERISFVDFYRYVDVELADVLDFLSRAAPWVRPRDTGRSTNCLINAAGIHTHLTEQGYHNYAVPYAWDVRLGHKTRQEAIDELDDDLDLDAVAEMLQAVGYEPTPREVLTAWFETTPTAVDPLPAELRAHLGRALPAHAVPAAFVRLDVIPTTSNGKVDVDSLPAPTRTHRSSTALHVAAETVLEGKVIEVFERVLRLEPIGVTDDFFELGGDSLAALELVVELGHDLRTTLREEAIFERRTPRDLAAWIESGEAAAHDDTPATRPAEEPPPISATERAMLFEHLSRPDDPRYNVAHTYRIHGPVDTPRLVAAIRAVGTRHVSLCWTFGDPRRHLGADDAIDVMIRSQSIPIDDVEAVLRRFHIQPFDLDGGPLARCVLQPIDDGSLVVALIFHHVSVDAGSVDRLWQQVDDEYCDRPIQLPGFDYADHAAWQADRRSEVDLDRWLVDGELATIDFGGRRAADDREGGYRQRRSSVRFGELRSGPGATPFATALAALLVMLRRRADGDRIGVGLTMSTREHPAADPLVGLFLTTIPVEIDVAGGATGAEIAERASETVADAMRVRTVPLAEIVAARRRHGLPPPSTSILVAYEHWRKCRLGDLSVDHEVLATGSPVADVTFFVQVHDDRVELSVEHRTAVVDDECAVVMLDEWDATIRSLVDEPQAVVDAAAPPSAASGGPAPDDERPLHRAIAERTAEVGSEPAIIQGDSTVLHGELTRRSGALAARLRASGVRPGEMVGVVARRCAETVVAALGVMRAGAVYMPIDPDYPVERLRFMIEDAGVAVIVEVGGEGLPLDALERPLTVIEVPNVDECVDGADPPIDEVGPDDPAYVIYTSGSTGTPKGVVVRHRNIVASTAVRDVVYGGPVERFLVLSSLSFDSSLVGLLWTLWSGGAIVLPEPGRHDDLLHLDELIAARRVTHLLALPTLYRLLLDEAEDEQLASLRTVIVAGEPCTADVVNAHRIACPAARLCNEYGPTEATVWTHAELLDEWEDGPVPIGRPIPGVEHEVVGADDRPVPIGRVGELLVAGAGIASGYHGRPDLTAERFVTRIGLDGVTRRWYRTGDLVRSDLEGRLEFVGRLDDQIKISGHRVEPSEVEATLRSLRIVREAVVGAVEVRGRRQLAAWVVPEGDVGSGQLRAELATLLPDHLVPTVFVALSALPLGPNGKVDRRALPDPAPEVLAPLAVDEPAPNGVAELLAGIWSEVLGVAVGPDDNFFDLGGDSILSLQIVARARRADVELRPRDLFDHQTVRALSEHARPAAGTRAEQGPVVGDVGLTPIAGWFFDQDLVDRDHWNQSLWLDLDRGVDGDLLVRALERVRDHHDVLRSRFERTGERWRHVIASGAEPIVFLQVPDADAESAAAEVAGSLSIGDGRLIGLALGLDADGHSRRAFVTVHHLAIDAVSWTPLLEDWASAYIQLEAGEDVRFPAKSASVRQWSDALRRYAEREATGLAAWVLPADAEVAAPHVEDTVGSARVVVRELDEAVTTRLLRRVGSPDDTAPTVEEVLLAACAVAIPEVTDLPAIFLLEGHGREAVVDPELDLSRTVGWFTSLCPVDLRVDDVTDPTQVLTTTSRRLRSIPDRGIGFGVARQFLAGSSAGAAALPTIAVNYLGRLDRTVHVSRPFTSAGRLFGDIGSTNRRSHLLGVVAAVSGGRLRIEIDHDPGSLSPGGAARLGDRLVAVVGALAEPGPSDVDVPDRTRFDLVELADDDLDRIAALLDEVDGA